MVRIVKQRELIINSTKNEIEVWVKNDNLRFRKDQDFNSDYIVACNANRRYIKVYLFKRISDNRFEVVETSTFGPDVESIAAFVDGDIDVYWIEDILYDKNHKVLFELPLWIAERLQFYFNYYDKDKDLILTHLKEDIYISIKTGQNIILISEKKKVLFHPPRYNNSTEVCPTCEMIYLDDILFENFQITEELLQRLRELETIDEMKEMILRELTMNVI
jgi:hypothetical protein